MIDPGWRNRTVPASTVRLLTAVAKWCRAAGLLGTVSLDTLVGSASLFGLTWLEWKHPCSQELDTGAAIHGALERLEPIDLAFRVAARTLMRDIEAVRHAIAEPWSSDVSDAIRDPQRASVFEKHAYSPGRRPRPRLGPPGTSLSVARLTAERARRCPLPSPPLAVFRATHYVSRLLPNSCVVSECYGFEMVLTALIARPELMLAYIVGIGICGRTRHIGTVGDVLTCHVCKYVRGGECELRSLVGRRAQKRIDLGASEGARIKAGTAELWLPSWVPPNRPFAPQCLCQPAARAFAKSINPNSPVLSASHCALEALSRCARGRIRPWLGGAGRPAEDV